MLFNCISRRAQTYWLTAFLMIKYILGPIYLQGDPFNNSHTNFTVMRMAGKEKDGMSIVIAGVAGEGVQTIGELLTNSVAVHGY